MHAYRVIIACASSCRSLCLIATGTGHTAALKRYLRRGGEMWVRIEIVFADAFAGIGRKKYRVTRPFVSTWPRDKRFIVACRLRRQALRQSVLAGEGNNIDKL